MFYGPTPATVTSSVYERLGVAEHSATPVLPKPRMPTANTSASLPVSCPRRSFGHSQTWRLTLSPLRDSSGKIMLPTTTAGHADRAVDKFVSSKLRRRALLNERAGRLASRWETKAAGPQRWRLRVGDGKETGDVQKLLRLWKRKRGRRERAY